MGCASSSPFVSSGGGVLTAAKGAATDAVHVGEEAINDVKDTLNEKVGHVKEAVIGAVQNVGHGIENAFSGSVKKDIQDIDVMDKEITEKVTNGIETTATTMNSSDYKIIPLKDPNEKIIDDALDEISETYDENIHDVKDMVRDTTDTIKDTATNLSEDFDKILSDNSPIHSTDIDSLKTTSPEPEIESALANYDINGINPPTPKPTYSELEKLQSSVSDELSSTKERMKKSFNNRINQLNDEPIGGIYEHHHQKITDSEIALIREGVVAAAVPGVTGVLSKKETIKKKFIIRRTKMPDIKKNLQKSNILINGGNGNISTRWEKRHDKLAQMKIKNKKFERHDSSDTLWSGNSGEFTKPRTMYLVFGNNFLKTPKIKIIDGNNKTSRWMKKDKLDAYELDLYTGIVTEKDEIDDKKEPEQISSRRWLAKTLPSQQKKTLLRPLSQQRAIQRNSISPPQRPHSQQYQHSLSQQQQHSGRIQLRPMSPFKFPIRTQLNKQRFQNNNESKRFQKNNNEKFRIIDDIDRNSDKMRKEKAAEWLRNNNIKEKSFEEIPSATTTTKINRFIDLVDKRMKTTRIEKLFTNPDKEDYNKEVNQQKQNNFIEINNGIDVDRKIRIDGFLDDFRELKKGKSITKFRKADEIQRFQKPANNRESFRKLDNKKMDGEKKLKFINKNRNMNRNKFINESKSFYKYD